MTSKLPEWAEEPDKAQARREDESMDGYSTESAEEEAAGDDGLGMRAFQAVELGTVAAAGFLVSCNGWALVASSPAVKAQGLRAFVAVLALFVVVPVELNNQRVQEELSALGNFFFRGACYTFIGLLSMSLNEDVGGDNSHLLDDSLILYTGLASLGMMFAGWTYLLMAITCQQEKKKLMSMDSNLLREYS